MSRETHDQAATMALLMLQWLAEDSDRISRFCALSGLGPEELRSSINNKNFLGGIMDYVLANENDLLAFCQEKGVDPKQPGRLRQSLPGAAID